MNQSNSSGNGERLYEEYKDLEIATTWDRNHVVDDSLGRECWRFFLRSGGAHFVVNGMEMGMDEDENEE